MGKSDLLSISFILLIIIYLDLKQIEQKVLNQEYNCFADFIKDMTKIFDNCRYYNAKDSTFCKCAESLETYFLGKVRTFREILMKPDNE